jgi:hypothetical protein
MAEGGRRVALEALHEEPALPAGVDRPEGLKLGVACAGAQIIFPRNPLPRGVSTVKPRGMDKLAEIFRLQEELNKRIGVELRDLPTEEKTKWVLNYTRAMQQEIAELIDSVPWKWWAKYQDLRRAECPRRGGRPLPFSDLHGAGAWA